MHTTGLAITLSNDPVSRDTTFHQIAHHPACATLAPSGNSLAMAVQVQDADEACAVHEWLASLPGVDAVEVVFVHWDESEEIHDATS